MMNLRSEIDSFQAIGARARRRCTKGEGGIRNNKRRRRFAAKAPVFVLPPLPQTELGGSRSRRFVQIKGEEKPDGEDVMGQPQSGFARATLNAATISVVSHPTRSTTKDAVRS